MLTALIPACVPQRLRLCLTCLGVLVLMGCASAPKQNWSEEQSKPKTEFVLAPGDEVQISFFGAPELNTTQVIRRDGCIALRLVGDFRAEGKTPMALQQELAALYAQQLQVKEAAVEVRSMVPVFVAGAVKASGRIVLDRPLTALQAIMQTGGFNEFDAEPSTVIVIRHESSRWVGYTMDLSPALQGKPGPSFYLQPFDIVYVPRSRISKANQWVEQHINRMLPRLGVGFNSEGEVSLYR